MPDNPIILSREIVAESRLFGVERLALRFSNGEERVYERLRTPSIPAVLIVAVKENGNVVLIREYCCGTGRYELTLPKGAMDHPGEAVFEAANRELMEEAGYGAHSLTELKALSLSPAYMGHMIHIVLAQDLYPKTLPGDEPEPLEVVEHPLEDIESLLAMDDFTEARALAALYMARDIYRKRK
ncbi:ADP compounds hydrolase NudE [Ketobacter sp. MCCC 1A13808]|uniref:ADP compounds hydrolase NudE n=1 Tax=Ketobacter sp. MCCC 1A13808 TaxID=2602738 RepID=UPI000F1A8C56|nr:ADP compounds hydrolase NudE [Ketobacter sp. MCCC 1A13808]MVF14114.1 ADP compounds hydrolase NudE [Ketobacter sp. MCCC 1A13808]RLP55139.1 MAG: ADP compounds hydrolase NudE [Ketobacter sp.]